MEKITLVPHRVDYERALLRGDSSAASQAISSALNDGMSIVAIYQDIILPTQVTLGDRWHEGKLSIAEEHLATQITIDQMSRLRSMCNPDQLVGAKVVVTTVEGDRHVLGARMVADFLLMQGFDVDFLGSDTPTQSLQDFVASRSPDIVAIGVSTPTFSATIAECVAAIRSLDQPPKIIVGGPSWIKNNPSIQACAPDGVATSAEEAVMVCQQLLGIDPSLAELASTLKKIGERIARLRKTKKISQSELSEAASLDRAYLSGVENGKQNVTIGALLRISHGLGVNLKELIS